MKGEIGTLTAVLITALILGGVGAGVFILGPQQQAIYYTLTASDSVALIDLSQSMRDNLFFVNPELKRMVTIFTQGNSRFAMVTFSTDMDDVNIYDYESQFKYDYIDNFQSLVVGTTCTSCGLEKTTDMILTSGDVGNIKSIILITDGVPTDCMLGSSWYNPYGRMIYCTRTVAADEAIEKANFLKQMGVEIYVIKIGDFYDSRAVMHDISSGHVYTAYSSNLGDIVDSIVNLIGQREGTQIMCSYSTDCSQKDCYTVTCQNPGLTTSYCDYDWLCSGTEECLGGQCMGTCIFGGEMAYAGQCFVTNKPKYCVSDGVYEDKCSVCDCLYGTSCYVDGSCYNIQCESAADCADLPCKTKTCINAGTPQSECRHTDICTSTEECVNGVCMDRCTYGGETRYAGLGIDSCFMSKPKFCTAGGIVTDSCETCGCPNPSEECYQGSCYSEITIIPTYPTFPIEYQYGDTMTLRVQLTNIGQPIFVTAKVLTETGVPVGKEWEETKTASGETPVEFVFDPLPEYSWDTNYKFSVSAKHPLTGDTITNDNMPFTVQEPLNIIKFSTPLAHKTNNEMVIELKVETYGGYPITDFSNIELTATKQTGMGIPLNPSFNIILDTYYITLPASTFATFEVGDKLNLKVMLSHPAYAQTEAEITGIEMVRPKLDVFMSAPTQVQCLTSNEIVLTFVDDDGAKHDFCGIEDAITECITGVSLKITHPDSTPSNPLFDEFRKDFWRNDFTRVSKGSYRLNNNYVFVKGPTYRYSGYVQSMGFDDVLIPEGSTSVVNCGAIICDNLLDGYCPVGCPNDPDCEPTFQIPLWMWGGVAFFVIIIVVILILKRRK